MKVRCIQSKDLLLRLLVAKRESWANDEVTNPTLCSLDYCVAAKLPKRDWKPVILSEWLVKR